MGKRMLCLALAVVVVAGACGGGETEVTTSPAGDGSEELQSPPEPTVDPSEATAVPGTRPPAGATDLLLTANDLPGWEFSGPVDFPAEPTFESENCTLMNEAWAAHAEPGMRVRAGADGVSVRHAVVEMPDTAAADAVLAAADVVWEECVGLLVEGDQWWSEPVEAPAPDGWRASGLALGGDNTPVWIIGYWQRGSTVVFDDMNGDDVWNYIQPMFGAVAARIAGKPTVVPVAAPTPDRIPLLEQAQQATPIELPELLPQPLPSDLLVPELDEGFPPSTGDWADHPLARLAPLPADLGDGWRYGESTLNEATPSDPEAFIPGCDAVPPPTLDGFELEYKYDHARELALPTNEIDLLIGVGEAADVKAVIDAFRGLVECDLQGFAVGFELAEIDVAGADDMLLIRGVVDLDRSMDVTFAIAQFDDLAIGVSYLFVTGDGAEPAIPTPAEMAALIEDIAAKR